MSENLPPTNFTMARSPIDKYEPSAKKPKNEESPRSVTATASPTASPTPQTISPEAENKGQKGVYINITGDLRNARGVNQAAKIQRDKLAREIADKKQFGHMENIGLIFGGRRRRPGHKTTRRRKRVVHSRKSRKPRKYMKSRKPRKSRKSRRVKR